METTLWQDLFAFSLITTYVTLMLISVWVSSAYIDKKYNNFNYSVIALILVMFVYLWVIPFILSFFID